MGVCSIIITLQEPNVSEVDLIFTGLTKKYFKGV